MYDGFELLSKYLRENGFNDTDENLAKALRRKNDCHGMYRFQLNLKMAKMKTQEHSKIDALDTLLEKLFYKYDKKNFFDDEIVFYSNTKEQRTVTVRHYDNTNSTSNGVKGGLYFKITRGLDCDGKEKIITIIPEEKVY